MKAYLKLQSMPLASDVAFITGQRASCKIQSKWAPLLPLPYLINPLVPPSGLYSHDLI
jgi:hypothetical protein